MIGDGGRRTTPPLFWKVSNWNLIAVGSQQTAANRHG